MEHAQRPDGSELWIVIGDSYDCGLWTLVAVNALVFIAFAWGYRAYRADRVAK